MNILNFCLDKKDPRPWGKVPWFLDGKTVATDSRILISKKDIGPWQEANPDEFPVEGARELLLAGSKAIYAPANLFEINREIGTICPICKGIGIVHVIHCNECEGEGVVNLENDHNYYEVECKSCHGEGDRVYPHAKGEQVCWECGGIGYTLPDFEIHGVLVRHKLLQKILSIKGLSFSGSKDRNKLFFKGEDDISGVIMGLHR